MRRYFVPTIAIAMIVPAIFSARSDDVLTLDVGPICRGIASQSADPLGAGLSVTIKECLQSEQQVREQLKKAWSSFSTADKQHCVALAKTGGESSYTELLSCLEMSRDVRALKSTEAASAKPARTRTPSSPTPTAEPAPAVSASRPFSTNEPSNVGVDSTLLKELQQAKTDALDARTSEAASRRKLADAEAESKRAKEEAGRATKEAEQAKADAKTAREAKAEAERKVADAEAARAAAEERQRASESAARNEPGGSTWLPSWLRSWFGSWFKHKPSNP
jgi:hypothetical protein